ncbi:hypothetical protein TNCV_409831 [Trichonephila clavipes]|nr:hypothetical protein TNCV_409831 [Trichonephila clavipes]
MRVFSLVENPDNLFVKSNKLSPVLHVQDFPVHHSVLVRNWVQDFLEKEKDMRRRQSKTSLEMVALFRANPPGKIDLRREFPLLKVYLLKRPSERPAEISPLMDFLVNEVQVTSRIPTPPLITLCDKSTQTNPQPFISNS